MTLENDRDAVTEGPSTKDYRVSNDLGDYAGSMAGSRL